MAAAVDKIMSILKMFLLINSLILSVQVETMRGINKILLENILPAHVAEHFLATRANQVPN